MLFSIIGTAPLLRKYYQTERLRTWEFRKDICITKSITDDPLKGVKAPVANPAIVIKDHASQIQQMQAAALTDKHNRETGEVNTTPDFKSEAAVKSYIDRLHGRYYS
jgi:hypothetical protein